MAVYHYTNNDGSTVDVNVPDPIITVPAPQIEVPAGEFVLPQPPAANVPVYFSQGRPTYTQADPAWTQSPPTMLYTPASQVPVPARMLIGMDMDPLNLTTYPGVRYQRKFAGTNLPNLNGVPPGVSPHPSISTAGGTTRPSDSAMIAYLQQSGPTADDPWMITMDHEANRGTANGKPSPTVYKANYQWLRTLIDTYAPGRWLLTELFSTYAQIHNVGDYHTYTNGLRSDGGITDVIGWDCYVDANQNATTYPTIESAGWTDIFVESKATVVAELGAPPRPSDTTLTLVSDFYAGAVDDFAALGVTHLAFWATVGSQFDYTPPANSVYQWAIRRLIWAQ